MAMTTTIVAYDISSDSVRARVSAMLQVWGERLQESVFLCEIEPEDLKALEERVLHMIDLTTDALLVLPLCGVCRARQRVAGQYLEPSREPCWAVF